jgi:hypothetical protein
MYTRTITIFLSSLLLYACASPSISQLDERNNRIGSSRQQLISDLGPPAIELHTAPEGGLATTALVYRDRPKGRDCVDAYLVETASGTVIDYYCH